MDTKRPELSNNDDMFESTLEGADLTDLLDEDHAASDRNDFVPEVTDISANEVPADEEQLEDVLLLTDEPHDDLTYDELLDADVENEHSETFSDDEDVVFARSDSGLETDLSAEEVFAEEEPETESTELFEDDLLLADEPHDNLTYDELLDADVEDEHSDTFSDDEDIVFTRSDSGLETDLSAEEVFAEEEPETESTELFEDDLLLTDEPHDDLTYDELLDADVENEHSETFSDDEDVVFARSDSGLETDLSAEEVFAEEEPETESTELFEDDLLLTDEPHDDLTYDELLDADVEDEHSETFSDDEDIVFTRSDFGVEADLQGDDASEDEDLEFDSMELLEDDLLLTDEPLEGLNLKELIERGWEADVATEENGCDPVSEQHGFTEKDDAVRTVLETDNVVVDSEVKHPVVVEKRHDKAVSGNVTKQGSLLQSSENLFHMSYEKSPAAENCQDTGKQFFKHFNALAILLVVGVGAGGWYAVNSIGNGTQALGQGQEKQGYQLNRDKLNGYAAQEGAKIKQPESTSIIQLENRVSQIRRQQDSMHSSLGSVERGIAEITSSVTATQNDSPSKEIQNETEPGHGGAFTPEDVAVSERRAGIVSTVSVAAGTVQEIPSQSDKMIPAKEVGLMEPKETQKEIESVHGGSFTPEDIVVSEKTAGVVSAVPVDAGTVQETPSQSDKIIPVKEVGFMEAKWVVNLASFKNRASAEKEQNRFNALGVKTIIYKAQVMETNWYRVRVDGFSSVLSARKYLKNVQMEFDGVEDAWVSSCLF